MIRENSPYRFLVEGPDDKHCVIHLMRRHGINWDRSPRSSSPYAQLRRFRLARRVP